MMNPSKVGIFVGQDEINLYFVFPTSCWFTRSILMRPICFDCAVFLMWDVLYFVCKKILTVFILGNYEVYINFFKSCS